MYGKREGRKMGWWEKKETKEGKKVKMNELRKEGTKERGQKVSTLIFLPFLNLSTPLLSLYPFLSFLITSFSPFLNLQCLSSSYFLLYIHATFCTLLVPFTLISSFNLSSSCFSFSSSSFSSSLPTLLINSFPFFSSVYSCFLMAFVPLCPHPQYISSSCFSSSVFPSLPNTTHLSFPIPPAPSFLLLFLSLHFPSSCSSIFTPNLLFSLSKPTTEPPPPPSFHHTPFHPRELFHPLVPSLATPHKTQ